MKKSGLVFVDQFPRGLGGDGGRNWTAEFVGEELQRAACLPREAHLLVKTPVAGGRRAAVERSAEDGMARIGQHNALRSDFRLGVNAQRADRIGFDIVPLAPVEDEVAGE